MAIGIRNTPRKMIYQAIQQTHGVAYNRCFNLAVGEVEEALKPGWTVKIGPLRTIKIWNPQGDCIYDFRGDMIPQVELPFNLGRAIATVHHVMELFPNNSALKVIGGGNPVKGSSVDVN